MGDDDTSSGGGVKKKLSAIEAAGDKPITLKLWTVAVIALVAVIAVIAGFAPGRFGTDLHKEACGLVRQHRKIRIFRIEEDPQTLRCGLQKRCGRVALSQRDCVAQGNALRCGKDGLRGTLSIEGVGQRYSAALVKVFWRCWTCARCTPMTTCHRTTRSSSRPLRASRARFLAEQIRVRLITTETTNGYAVHGWAKVQGSLPGRCDGLL